MLMTIALSFLVPIIMFLFGLLLWFAPTGKPNKGFGYRTKRSMFSQETWDYAQVKTGQIYTLIGFLLMPTTYYLVSTLSVSYTSDSGGLLIIILSLQCLLLFLPLIWIEYQLKKQFSM